ncbi:MAG: hypothetical protein OEY63_07615, partial [Gemmatimonadota bacterium]|nr:hypothetical protein [Gemmatimonadota bacterium]
MTNFSDFPLVKRDRTRAPAQSPNDTRYPVPAIAAGAISGLVVGGLSWLLPFIAEPAAPVIGAVAAVLAGAS